MTYDITKLLNGTYRAEVGSAQGVGKTKKEAIAACDADIESRLRNGKSPQVHLRHDTNGLRYIVTSMVESAESAWYSVTDLDTVAPGESLLRCFTTCRPGLLTQYIESLLEAK